MRSISALSGFLQSAESHAPLPPCTKSTAPGEGGPSVPQQKTLTLLLSTTQQKTVTLNDGSLPKKADVDVLPGIMGTKMRINTNNCPSELRRPLASPYVVIQKYNKAYYAKKQFWAKVYEVEYCLVRNPLSVDANDGTKEEIVEGTKRRSFIAATGDEIGTYGEGTTSEEAVSELQSKISGSILQLLEEGMSHCLPTKRKYQDVLLKDFEEEMVSHGVRMLSPPKYVPVPVSFNTVGVRKSKPVDEVPEKAAIEAPENVAKEAQPSQEQEPPVVPDSIPAPGLAQGTAHAPAPEPAPAPAAEPASKSGVEPVPDAAPGPAPAIASEPATLQPQSEAQPQMQTPPTDSVAELAATEQKKNDAVNHVALINNADSSIHASAETTKVEDSTSMTTNSGSATEHQPDHPKEPPPAPEAA